MRTAAPPPAELPKTARRASARRLCVSAALPPLAVALPDAHAAHAAGFLFIDVRSAREHRSESISAARSAPLLLVPSTVPLGAIDWFIEHSKSKPPDERPPFSPTFEADVKKALGADQQRPALLFCSDGSRSQQACSLLAGEGYSELRWLQGGLTAWLAAYSSRGVPRKRVQSGVFVDTSSRAVWTDSAEEDTVLPVAGDLSLNSQDVVH